MLLTLVDDGSQNLSRVFTRFSSKINFKCKVLTSLDLDRIKS